MFSDTTLRVGYDLYSVFERLHRFIGWIALGLTCEQRLFLEILHANGGSPGAFTILEDLYNTKTETWNLGVEHVLRQQDFWFAVGMTIL